MQAQSYTNVPGYLFILTGLILSLISALAPHFEAGYRLMLSVFVAGMLPYVIYGIAVVLLRGSVTTVAGLVIVVIHALLVINERITGQVDYSDGVIYFGPMIIAVAALPLALFAIKKSRHT